MVDGEWSECMKTENRVEGDFLRMYNDDDDDDYTTTTTVSIGVKRESELSWVCFGSGGFLDWCFVFRGVWVFRMFYKA